MKFTETLIGGFVVPAGKASAIVFDSQVTGLGLKATAAGSKIFLFQYWSGARVHRLTLGKHGDLTLSDARRIAGGLRIQVAAGASPAEDRKRRIVEDKKHAEKTALTLLVLIEQWRSLALKDRSPGYKTEATRALRKAYSIELHKAADLLTGADVQLVLDSIAALHPTTARRVRAYTRAMFGWAVKRGLVPENPCARVVVESRESSRERVLSDAELGEAWRAAGHLSLVAVRSFGFPC